MKHGLRGGYDVDECNNLTRVKAFAQEKHERVKMLEKDNARLEKERDRYAKSIKIRDMIGQWGEVAGQAWAGVQLVIGLFFAVFAIAAGAFLGIHLSDWLIVVVFDVTSTLQGSNR